MADPPTRLDDRAPDDRGLGERGVADRALDRDEDTPRLRSAVPARVRPDTVVAAPIPCARVSSDLQDLIDTLLDCAQVGVRLNRDRFEHGETSDLTVDFDLMDGSKLVRWSVPGAAASVSGTHRPAVTTDRHDRGRDLPPESSVTAAALERARREVRRHLRLFVEVIAAALPDWGRRYSVALEEMGRWVNSWPRDPLVPRFPIVAGEKPANSFTTAGLAVDDEVQARIREWLHTPTSCVVSELSVHFHHARPRDLADTQDVLADPAELDAVLRALADLVDRALVPLRLTIHGHTDASGSARRNRALAVRRAQWVRDRLAHLPFGAVDIRGFGESQASGPIRNPADRHVDLLVAPR